MYDKMVDGVYTCLDGARPGQLQAPICATGTVPHEC